MRKIIFIYLFLLTNIYSYEDTNFLSISAYNYLYNKNISRKLICKNFENFREQLLKDLISKDKKKIYSHLRTDFFGMYNYFTKLDIDERENFTYTQFLYIWEDFKEILPQLVKAVENKVTHICNNKKFNDDNYHYFEYSIVNKNISYQIDLTYIYNIEKWRIHNITISEIK
jgi:hypothetical protein